MTTPAEHAEWLRSQAAEWRRVAAELPPNFQISAYLERKAIGNCAAADALEALAAENERLRETLRFITSTQPACSKPIDPTWRVQQ
jgi:hypothetical protein